MTIRNKPARSAPEPHHKNRPGKYHCPHCGELLSSDPRHYTCPRRLRVVPKPNEVNRWK